MNPRPIVYQDKPEDILGYACSKCGLLSTDKMFGSGPGAKDQALRAATECCDKKCEDCGGPCEVGWVVCKECRPVREKKREREAVEKATKVPLGDYKGEYVFIDGFGNDGYVLREDVEQELRDHQLEAEKLGREPTLPEFGWACIDERAHFDLKDAVENYVHDEHYEDAFDHVDGELLEVAHKLVNRALDDVVSYHEDQSVAVVLPTREQLNKIFEGDIDAAQ